MTTAMDVVPTTTGCCSAPSPSYHMSHMNNMNKMNKMNNMNVNTMTTTTMNSTNSRRGAAIGPPHVPPLTGFSGGLSKNMDLHSQGQHSHPVAASLFGSTSSVWRLSNSQSSFSLPSPSSSDTLSSDIHSHTTTSFATTNTKQVQAQGEPENEENSLPDEYLHSAAAAADDNNEDEYDDDDEEEDDDHEEEDEEEEDITRVELRKPHHKYHNYQYRHIFSNSAPAPASTPHHHPQFFEFSFNIMTGPDRTNDSASSSSSHRANPLAAPNQPPRPPNAWILYRSDKLKNIPSPPPGAPKRPQAEVSKMISQMWKLETADVRSHYERLSEIKKAEHQAMYPGYRFQPMKKEDKDRIRAEKQAEKEKEREARKASRKTRQTAGVGGAGSQAETHPPLFTNQARPLPSSLPAAPGAVPNGIGLPLQPPTAGSSSSLSSSSSSSGPPGDLPTPPGDNDGCTPPSQSSQPQPSSSSSDPISAAPPPPLLAPQPTPVIQCPPSPSAWHDPTSVSNTSLPQHQQQDTPFSLDSIPTWFDSSLFLPDPPSDADGYITVPLPSQQPLGWSPDDPGPLSDMHLSFFDQPSTSQQQQHPTLSIRTTGLPSNIPSNPAHNAQAQSNSAPPLPPLTTTMATAAASSAGVGVNANANASLTPATTTVSPDQLQLHAVVAATNDPNIFALDFDFTNNELFDGTREISVSMAPNMLLSSAFNNNDPFGTGSVVGNDDFASLLNWDAANFSGNGGVADGSGMGFPFSSSYPTGDVDFSLPLGLDLGIDIDMDGMNALNASGAGGTMSLPPSLPQQPPPPPSSDTMGLNGNSSFSTMMSATPSATSANTSQTSLHLHPTPPPPLPWSVSAPASTVEGVVYQKGVLNSDQAQQQQQQQRQQEQQSAPTTTAPYVPPAGAVHSSTRRVAADWRRIRAMTPDPEHEPALEFSSRQDGSNP